MRALGKLAIATVCSACAVGCASVTDAGAATWTTENVGAPLNSPHNELFPTMTHDGLAIYFASDRHLYADGEPGRDEWFFGDVDIFVARRDSLDAPWREPQRLGANINTPNQDHSVTISHDGHWMIFGSTDRPDTCGGMDLYITYRDDVTDDLGWGEARNLGCELNSEADDACPITVTRIEEGGASYLYFVSTRDDGPGGWDAYVSAFDPATGVASPARLIAEVSTPGFEGHLDPEQGYVWADREGGYGGLDLWVAERVGGTETWSIPVNAGPEINTPYDEQMPSPVLGDAGILYPSNRPGGEGGVDLYISMRVDAG